MSDFSIFEKILNPYPSILGYLDQLNRQLNLSTGSFTPEQYGTLTAAKRNCKPFIIGIIPPDNVVNFLPVETKQPGSTSDLGSAKSSVSSTAQTQAAGGLFTNEQLVQKSKNGTLGPANDPVTPLYPKTQAEAGTINQSSLETLANTGFYSTLNTVAQRQNTTPEDILVVFWGESHLGSTAKNKGGAVGIFQIQPSEANKLSKPAKIAPYITNMSATQQLTYYDQYIGNCKAGYAGDKPLNALQLYLMNAGKAGLINQTNNPLAQVVDDQDYNGNKALDLDGDGKITMKDMKQRVENIKNDPGYKTAVEALKQQTDNTPTTQPTRFTNNIGDETRSLMAYGRVTQAETDDLTLRLGKNIELASAYRVGAAILQTNELKRQIDVINATPPLIMLVNPSEFTRNYEHTTDSSIKGRFGHIVQIWLERPMKINGRGVSAGQYAIVGGGFGGLTTENRIHSLSYQNLMSLFMIYKNNGVIFAGNESQAGIPILTCSIYIYYDNHIYIGSFNDFSIDDNADKPFNMAYSFSFDVRYDLDIDSSQLIETRIAR